MEQKSVENRNLNRVRVQFPVGIVGDLLDGQGQLVNLSPGGCRIKGDQSLKDSAYLRLMLYAPNDPVPIKIELAIIRWVSGDEYGIEFIRVHADHQARLRQLLKFLEMQPGLEQRGQAPMPAFQPA